MSLEMNATWLTAAVILPLMAGLLGALLLWLARASDDFGSIVGTGIVLLFAVFHISREFGMVLKIQEACTASGLACHFKPEPFTRYAIYGGVAMLQIFIIFWIGLRTEEHLRQRDRAREARRQA